MWCIYIFDMAMQVKLKDKNVKSQSIHFTVVRLMICTKFWKENFRKPTQHLPLDVGARTDVTSVEKSFWLYWYNCLLWCLKTRNYLLLRNTLSKIERLILTFVASPSQSCGIFLPHLWKYRENGFFVRNKFNIKLNTLWALLKCRT